MQTLRLLILFFSVLLCACSNSQLANDKEDSPVITGKKDTRKTLQGKVVGISDGDTFRLLLENKENVRVRLYGVDAPEKGQDYATQSQQALSSLVFSKEVRVEQKNKDRYGRVVGVAFVDELNVNEEMLRQGMVWQYRQYDKSERWASLEKEAQQKSLGLWNKPSPTPPWQWRKDRREKQQQKRQLEEQD